MLSNYQLVSPSLEGLLSDSFLMYEGIERPVDILRVLDGPATKSLHRGETALSDADKEKMLERYFDDLYRIFIKKLALFVVEDELADEETLKLLAMLQEMIKVKKLISKK